MFGHDRIAACHRGPTQTAGKFFLNENGLQYPQPECFAGRVIFMDRGQLVEQDKAAVFFDNPQNERSKKSCPRS